MCRYTEAYSARWAQNVSNTPSTALRFQVSHIKPSILTKENEVWVAVRVGNAPEM